MQIKVTAPAHIHTTIQLPSSKSISNRVLIINALANGTFRPENLSDCDDTQVMIRALNDGQETIDIMAAGTAMRFLTAYLSVAPGTRTITGTQRMQQRPIQVLVNALRELGAEITYTGQDGFPPLRITGHPLEKDTGCYTHL
ncbi:MAG: 3-phosphoshikimate 1-carboxyvinyltransferase, partial [Phocaeicola sp.]|nr:3-phosphoshikimate 1-carboxyvinyltransferase [Phocaeicola sp.]